VPTLVLHRTGDPLCPIEGGRYLAEQIDGARFVELAGCDHAPFVGDVDAIVDAVQEFLTGVRPTRPRDRVLATVLLTEVVEATETAARLGNQRWDELLSAYQAIVRHELANCRGSEMRMTGVGFLATFDGPARAIRCALAIGEATRRLGVQVRCGLHAGEIDVLAGDIGGVAVEIAARVMARAGPGETLVSNTVKDLVVGSGIEFEELDTRLLTAQGESWRIHRVGRETKAVGDDAQQVNSPEAVTGRFGAVRISPREREIAALVARGFSNRQIAEELSISVATAERHVANILNKLGYHSRAQVAAWAVELGLQRDHTR
jgi:class 3 adenylate cyclase/DNA-binding CsgD family transcriptional regulator